MERNLSLRLRMSPLARLSVVALTGAVLAGAPMTQARAADARIVATADDEEEPFSGIGSQLAAKRRDAGDRLRGLVLSAFDRTAQRMQDARRGMERLVTFGYGLEGLDALDFSALADPEVEDREDEEPREEIEAEEPEGEGGAEDEAPAQPSKPKRFEYVEGTDDPLAGL